MRTSSVALHASRLGQVAGTHWTVVVFLGYGSGKHPYYQCRCACGTERPVDWVQLVRGRSRSCGKAACSFATNGRPCTILLEHDGQTRSIAAWAQVLGVSADRLYTRMYAGKSVAEILDQRNYRECLVTAFSRTLSIAAWARERGMKSTTLRKRLEHMAPEEALTRPVQ